MQLLHIDSSILGQNSVSRILSAAAARRLEALHRGLAVAYRDLAASPIGHLSGSYLAGQSADVQHDQSLQTDLELGGSVLAEFQAADILVLGAPMYNLSVPSQLKSWIDRIVVAGKTFRYGERGAEGLAGDKRVVLALSRGGFYGPGSPAASLEFQESYLRKTLGFLGITRIESFVAEGVGTGPEQRQKAIDAALEAIGRLAA